MPAGNPLHVALSSSEFTDVADVYQVTAMNKFSTEQLLTLIYVMHKDVIEVLSDFRMNPVARHNARTHISPYLPVIGDYVVVAQTSGPRTKMSAKWIGPRRVVRALYDFTVEI